ncbi:C2 domain-containing protein [Phycomyces nitens]|nr:C2 domain-containing protein [Phycomyces nitens]
MLPDFRNLGNRQSGLHTELKTSDATEIVNAIEAAQKKPVVKPIKSSNTLRRSYTGRSGTLRTPKTPAGPASSSHGPRIPDWFRVGWTSFSTKRNPGGSLNMRATDKKDDPLDECLETLFYGDAWQHSGIIFVIGFLAWLFAVLGGGLPTIIAGTMFLGTYYHLTNRRFVRNARDDIQREFAVTRVEEEPESVDWLNNFVEHFWLIFDPVMSAYVIENMDTYLVDYLPSFLDSVRLTTFTLGSRPFRIEAVKTIPTTESNTVCMDWTVAFTPTDVSNMTQKEIELKVNPKVALNIRLGKGMVGTAFTVLVEDMSFRGQMRVKMKLISKFPHVKLVEACFLDYPQFDYVLKPLGGDTFGFDVNNIPGLQGFVRDQVHAVLGPMMYYPNVFSFDVEKFFSGELDITQANGVLAITVYSCSTIDSGDTTLNPFIRFFLDKAQELGRTSVRENTLQPIWNETHFLLLNNLNSIMTLELRSHSTSNKDRRIARANFDLKDLEEDDNEIQGLDLLLLRHGKPLSDVKVDMRYMPVSKPTPREDGTIEPPAESNSGVLRFTIHECRNLGSTKLNPYARVLINGAENIKTPVFKRTSNPKFERPGEVVVLDKTEVSIRVEIKDSVSFAEDVTLGVWTAYLVDVMQQQDGCNYWWDLKNGTKDAGRIRFSVQWKPVVMAGLAKAMCGNGYSNPPIGVVRFSFWEAHDLRNVEAATGSKSDPYVRVLSGTQIRARTEVVDNNLNPEWGEYHYVPVHSIREDLVLEVMDWNAKSKDKTLGYTILHMKDLVRQRTNEHRDYIDKWFEPLVEKLERRASLSSTDKKAKGTLQYTAEFYPTLALPSPSEAEEDEHKGTQETTDNQLRQDPTVFDVMPEKDLHGSYIKYTPDDMIDLPTYNSGVVTVRIHEVKLSKPAHAYCQFLVDSIMPQFKTSKQKGDELVFNESADAFVKEADFSRVAIEIKPADTDEKDDVKLGYWVESTSVIIRRIQNKRRQAMVEGNELEEGDWFNLLGTEAPGMIRLSFDYTPLIGFTLNPDESLENQGNLTVTLVRANKLKGVDKSGTSDPYVIFTVNGTRVHKSAVIKKNNDPVWKNEQFVVPIQSRVTASFRIEVFDWNQFQGDEPLGSGGVSIRGDSVESFAARNVEIPLDGVAGVTGSVQVRFLWQPQLLIRKKTNTSVLGTTRMYTSTQMATQVGTRVGTQLLGRSGTQLNPPTPSRTTSLRHTTPGILPRSIQTMRQDTMGSIDSGQLVDSPVSRHSRQLSTAESINSTLETNSLLSSEHDSALGGEDSLTGMEGSVMINLIEARGLRGVDKGGTSDPFVRVRIGKSHAYKTKHIKKTLTPVWNESFKYPVPSTPIAIDFKVKDYNRFSSSVDLGECQWNLWSLLRPEQSTIFEGWLPLYPAGSGEIHVRMEFS